MDHWNFIDGKTLLAGIDLEALPLARMLNVLGVLRAEQKEDPPEPVSEWRELIEEKIADVLRNDGDKRESWGTSPEAVAAQDAFMKMGNV